MTDVPRDPDGDPATPLAVAEPYRAYRVTERFGEEVRCLVFRLTDGRRVARAYFWLSEAEYLPGVGVQLTFSDAVFTLRGRHLLGLFAAASEHTLREVWEADRATALLLPDDAPLVEAVERTPVRG